MKYYTEGFKVCTFTDPLEAFDRLQKRTEEYAIVISDYKMPTMNGNKRCNKLIRLNPKLKVILISAYDNVKCNISKIYIFTQTYTNR